MNASQSIDGSQESIVTTGKAFTPMPLGNTVVHIKVDVEAAMAAAFSASRAEDEEDAEVAAFRAKDPSRPFSALLAELGTE